MSEMQVLKPQKTWSHLAARRRKPSEYEIVSANLHYNDRDANAPYELAPGMFMNEWYKKNTFGTALKHADWNAFRDPDEVVYRTYNMMQDGQETYVFGLFDQFNQREHDKALDPRWAGSLARLYTPALLVGATSVARGDQTGDQPRLNRLRATEVARLYKKMRRQACPKFKS